jgi:hypothetical protein
MLIDALLAVRIKIPAVAVVPLTITFIVLAILLFAGGRLVDWKQRRPNVATKVGLVTAIALTGYALYVGATIIPALYIDHAGPGQPTIDFIDAPIMGITAIFAALSWRFANQRWIARGVGLSLGIAIFMKPFIVPLHRELFGKSDRVWGLMDPEHLSFLGPGAAVIIAGLFIGSKIGVKSVQG